MSVSALMFALSHSATQPESIACRSAFRFTIQSTVHPVRMYSSQVRLSSRDLAYHQPGQDVFLAGALIVLQSGTPSTPVTAYSLQMLSSSRDPVDHPQSGWCALVVSRSGRPPTQSGCIPRGCTRLLATCQLPTQLGFISCRCSCRLAIWSTTHPVRMYSSRVHSSSRGPASCLLDTLPVGTLATM